jgi:hypothetical protein
MLVQVFYLTKAITTEQGKAPKSYLDFIHQIIQEIYIIPTTQCWFKYLTLQKQ